MRKRKALPDAPLVGSVTVPGDKSISHRALILAALAEGSSTVRRMNTGEDVAATVRTLVQLGARCEVHEASDRAEVEGRGWDGLHEADDVLWAGNSGTTLRCLLGVCAGVEGLHVLTGDESLRSRPMLRVVAPLRQMGASIDGRSFGARAPLTVRGGPLEGAEVELPVASAQVKTALLLGGLRANGRTRVVEPGVSRDHSERMLAASGVQLERSDGAVSLEGGQRIHARDWTVPGDFSSAAFLISAAVLLEGSDLTIERLGVNPTRTALLDVLQRMGADVDVRVDEESCGEPVGTVFARYSQLSATSVSPAEVPRLIDELPVLAVVATQARGETELRGASELRVKESDRIEVVVNALKTLGADVEALPDGMVVRGPTRLHPGDVDAGGDHRVALALAVAGFLVGGDVRIRGWSSINTSFPEFLDVLVEARGGR